MWQNGAYTQLAAPQYPPYPQTQQQYAQYTSAVYQKGGQGKRQNQNPQPWGGRHPKQQQQQQAQQWPNQTKQYYSPHSSQQDLVRGYPSAAPYGLRMSNPYYDSGYQSSTPPHSDANNGYTYPQPPGQPQQMTPERHKKREEDEETLDSEAVPRDRLVKIVVVVLCIVVIGIIVAAVAVWLALSTSSDDSSYDTTYNVIVKLNEDWHKDLENANSVTYYDLEMRYCSAISSIYGGLFKKCTVQQFLEGSVLVDSALTFDLQKLEDRIREQGHTPDEVNLLGSLIKDLKDAISSKEYEVLLNAEINTFNKYMGYQFIIKFNETFLDAWGNPEDPAFTAKEQEYCQDIKTILGAAYADCEIEEMKPGSTIIHSKITLVLKSLITLTSDPEATNKDFINTLNKLINEAIKDSSPKNFKNAEIQTISKFQKVLVVPFESAMTLQEVYDPAYSDLKSPQSKKLTETFCAEISALYKESEIGSAYEGCEVTDLKSGSVIVTYVSLFVEDKLANSDGNVDKVKDIVVAAIAQSSGILGKADPESISVKQLESKIAQTPSEDPPSPIDESTVAPSTVQSSTQSTAKASTVVPQSDTSSQAPTSKPTDGGAAGVTTQASTALASTQSDKETSTQGQTSTQAATTATVATTEATTQPSTTAEATTTAATTEATSPVATTTEAATSSIVTTTGATSTVVVITTEAATSQPSTAISTTQEQTSTAAPSTAETTQEQTSTAATTTQKQTEVTSGEDNGPLAFGPSAGKK